MYQQRYCFIIVFLCFVCNLRSQPPTDIRAVVSEINYADFASQFIDISVCGFAQPADIGQYSVVVYSATTGTVGSITNLSQFTANSISLTTTIYTNNQALPFSGGIVILDPLGNLLNIGATPYFISWGASPAGFTAVDGPAIGLTSSDIDVTQTSSAAGSSLIQCGSFVNSFQNTATATPGAANSLCAASNGAFIIPEFCAELQFFSGSVKDELGNPLAGEVVTFDFNGGYPESTLTDANGMFYGSEFNTSDTKFFEHLPSAGYTSLSDDDDSPEDSNDNDGVVDNRIYTEVQTFEWDADNNFVKQSLTVPVDYLDFIAIAYESYVEIDWSTASEINNDFFQLEKSHNGEDFYPIHIVRGHQQSLSIKEYSFRDQNVFTGDNYYRLMQVDLDGTKSYSDRIVVNKQALENRFKIYPNPTTDFIMLNSNSLINEESITLIIRELNGSEVLRKSMDTKTRINVSDKIVPGLYMVSLLDATDNLIYHTKLSIVK